MQLTVILETENRDTISSLGHDFFVDSKKLNEFKLLKYLDPYGDTTFNRIQMDDLIEDLRGLP